MIMTDQSSRPDAVYLPDDLVDEVNKLAQRLGESPGFIVIAAVEHFTRIPEEQRKAVVHGTSIRRRGE